MCMTMTRTLESDDTWTTEKLETHLLARENMMKIESNSNNDNESETTKEKRVSHDVAHMSLSKFTHRRRGNRKEVDNDNDDENENNKDNKNDEVPKVCRWFYSTGKCKFGSKCWHLHINKENQKDSAAMTVASSRSHDHLDEYTL